MAIIGLQPDLTAQAQTTLGMDSPLECAQACNSSCSAQYDVLDPVYSGDFRNCVQSCSTGCPGGAAALPPAQAQCIGLAGELGCTLSGVADDLAAGGRTLAGAGQAVSQNLGIIVVLGIAIVALLGLRELRA